MMKTIKNGSSGTEVKILQHALGYGNQNGISDRNFESFVRKYQSNNDLIADGIAGKNTWTKVFSEAPLINEGSRGSWVSVWQLILGSVTVDGIFGAKTKRATKTYQASSGLSADGIVGKRTWASVINTVVNDKPTTGTNTKKPVDYKQYDRRWGKVVYTQNNTHNKKQTIKNSGCGVTAGADVVATFWDKSVTPKTLAQYSVANGYRTKNSGTAWPFFRALAQKYKASKFVQTSSYTTAKNALGEGAIVVVSVGPSIFTKNGHFITWWKSEGGYNYVNDPASASSSRAKNLEKHIRNAAKQFFIFWK